MSDERPQQKYRSALSILRALPGVFDLSTLSRIAGIDRASAMTYAHRWGRSGMIKLAGPKTGVYYNVTRFPDAESEFAAQALLMEYPTATLCGASVLHSAGWTTQIPQRTTVAVLERRSYVEFNGFAISGRPREWFAAVHERISRDGDLATFGLRSLTPAMALADACSRPDGLEWRPDPDDIMLDDADPADIADAFGALGMSAPSWVGAASPQP